MGHVQVSCLLTDVSDLFLVARGCVWLVVQAQSLLQQTCAVVKHLSAQQPICGTKGFSRSLLLAAEHALLIRFVFATGAFTRCETHVCTLSILAKFKSWPFVM